MDVFLQQVFTFIQDHHLMPPGSRVITGVSGGADSLALLVLLAKLRGRLRLSLAAAHLNHGLRGQAADDDEQFVRTWCENLQVPFFSRKVDLRSDAESQRTGLEDAGRKARQAFFSELADRFETEGFPVWQKGLSCDFGQNEDQSTGHDQGQDQGQNQSREPVPGPVPEPVPGPVLIALAHHLDDQAETILLHLGRGCGLDGLTGMKPSNGRLIRPFLGQSRDAIRQWLRSQQISWREDDTNQELFALRNRIRHQVLPAWRQAIGYDPAPLLERTAFSLSEDQDFLDQIARSEAAKCLTSRGLQLEQLKNTAPAMQSRILRILWREGTGSSQDLAQSHLLALRSWLPSARPGEQISLPGKWLIILDADHYLKLKRQDEAIEPNQGGFGQAGTSGKPAQEAVPLQIPGITRLESWGCEIVTCHIENDAKIVYNDAMEYFRLDRLQGSVVRHRMPGDYIRPAGRLGGKTLKKYLNEQKIPIEERPRLIVVAKGRDIVWLPGLAAGADFTGRPGNSRQGPLVRLEWRAASEAGSGAAVGRDVL
jgi:tRNA(Ile)-lysidine synthase